ncbi:aldehyde dehydrogenase family protein [Kocuria rhizophila]|nr:aldehyde dehydrogenase family protein [Kocuria rhizophila]
MADRPATGSPRWAGGSVKTATDHVLRTSHGAGRQQPFIVFEDADLDKAVEGAMAAKMRNIGRGLHHRRLPGARVRGREEFSREVRRRAQGAQARQRPDELHRGPVVEKKALTFR